MSEQLREMRYEIGGKIYVMRALVLGQAVQLAELLSKQKVEQVESIEEFVKRYMSLLPRMLAIVLTPKGVPLKDKDVDAEEEHIAQHLDLHTLMTIVEDFFSSQDLHGLLTRLTQVIESITNHIAHSEKS